MGAALGLAWQRLRRSQGPLLLSVVLLATGCTPVRSSAPALFLTPSITAFDVRFRPRGHKLRRLAQAPAPRPADCPTCLKGGPHRRAATRSCWRPCWGVAPRQASSKRSAGWTWLGCSAAGGLERGAPGGAGAPAAQAPGHARHTAARSAGRLRPVERLPRLPARTPGAVGRGHSPPRALCAGRPYERLRGDFARGLAFERFMLSVLREDAALPPAQRRWLSAFTQPRIEVHVGLSKPDVPGGALRGRARHRAAASPGPAPSRGDLQLQEPLPQAAQGRRREGHSC